ncbi:MAG: polysaccharide deacetylase family protein [Rhodospirillaceae bacterium]|jgi:allantoinase|nr:polysaccharide deacetylase family protein [Rhodospirillaceae bacterium]MBT5192973.1 polysaccharide deacetylase family protein [Rhodospirillaceae bacterium]MBT5895900.1 polysaccharide deacetylase family protein [Rhodospirillaceae bacterium]MBT6430975.1 polysaccharide deacetylase family protein [Rhodospirillaceae bacterium]MBT7755964.1 polysaccharide deacetylase family protein [Rhodospirillaceae bacterium]
MAKWNLPGGARIALSIVVNVEEGSEMSITQGDRGPEVVDELGVALHKPVRNYANESNYLYGLKAGAPRIMKLLDEHKIRATFTAAAQALEKAPDLTKAIVAGGHEVCSHGWRWVHQFHMDEEQEREFIRKAVSSIEKTTGTRPTGWLSRYLLTDNTRRLLVEEGFTYHMDDFSDDRPFWDTDYEKPILILPYALDSNDMKMWTAPSLTPADWLQYAVDTLDWLYWEGKDDPQMMSFGLHLRIIGRPGRIGYLEKFLQHVTTMPDVWIATRQEIAENWMAQNPAPQ